MYRINFKFAFVLSVLVFGLVLFLLPSKSHAGNAFIGCCITNGGQCNPSCGNIGTSCQRNSDSIQPCKGTEYANIAAADADGGCGSADAMVPNANQNCFVHDAVCFQEDNNISVCLGAPPTPTPTATPSVTPVPCASNPECESSSICFIGECIDNVCVFSDNPEEADNPECVSPPPTPTTVVPTLNQWGIIIAVLVIGFFAVMRLWIKKDSDI